jgi:putative DNA primase/helicase
MIATVATLAEIDIIGQFRAALATHDLRPDEIKADGRIHRFHVSGGKPQNRDGWYVLHLDGRPAGAFGDHRRINQKWKLTDGCQPLTAADRAVVQQEIAQQRRERRAQRAAAACTAQRLATAGSAATGGHSYERRKGITFPADVRRIEQVARNTAQLQRLVIYVLIALGLIVILLWR